MPDFYLNSSGNYNFYSCFVKDYLKENGYDFFDFNLCKQKYLKLQDCDFYDNNHLNNNGMKKFTDVFFQFITKAKNQNEMFFSTYKEKLEIQQPCILWNFIEETFCKHDKYSSSYEFQQFPTGSIQ